MENLVSQLLWWGWLASMGIISFPSSTMLFNKFFDKGWGLTKTLTIISTSYFVFLLSTAKILTFSRLSIIFALLVFALLNLAVYSKNKEVINRSFKQKSKIFIFEESLFTLGLFLWAFVRSHNPSINGLEKFMDFGFVNSILRTKFLPPLDMWASGNTINYYWYGHFITAFLIKLTNIKSGVGYNLMLGTILGLSLSASFSFVSSLLNNVFKGKAIKTAVIGGLISAILLNFAGNFHTPIYTLKDGASKYWYPDATRFIGYNPDVPDKTIHEFPIYSYVVSDLHAHLLNLPFVIFFISGLYTLVSMNKKNKFFYSNLKHLLFVGFLLGVMFMTNAWDIANYLLVTGFVFLMATKVNLKKMIAFQNILKISINLIIIILAAIITTTPFLASFQSIAQGVNLTHTKTPLWQLGVLWGFPLILTMIFVLRILIFKKNKQEDRFILALLIASWSLIAIPEFIYVKDIYASTHYRANTMFKLTYQAYVMFYLSSGYIAVTFIKRSRSIASRIQMILLLSIAFTSILYYPFLAIKSYYGNIFDNNNSSKNLQGDSWLQEKYPNTFNVVNWFNTNIKDQPTILEAPGDSYTDSDVISSYTGLPTVSGWYVHEWLWRGTPDFPQGRVNDIAQIYNTSDANAAKYLLDKYSVKYVIVGKFEKEKFPELNEEKFSQLGKVVYVNRTSKIYQIN